ncbi:MAG: AMP-binding protein, partial [bacterium]|nr:AMP-binding protein [bacterium]
YTFDASVNQVFSPLLHGSVVHVVPQSLLMDMEALRHYIDTRQIHIINSVPMLLKELLDFEGQLKSLRAVISGADRLTGETRDRLLEKGYVLHNHYGPTEGTIDAAACRCGKGGVTLGNPIANCRVYILDNDKNPQPIGVAGELFIAGAGLARGYLNNSELTADKFCRGAAPSLSTPRYRTGDLARWWADGNIEFLGRIDHQVKIRGFRIEPTGIEAQLVKHKDVEQAVVIAVPDSAGDYRLCAYVTARRQLTASELRNYLAEVLPVYMVPAFFMILDKIPVTRGGKVDRDALPRPEAKSETQYTAPRDEVEKKLVDIWQEVLNLSENPIGIDDNFFELGGHSLTVIAMTMRVFRRFNVKISMQEFFHRPVIRALAAYITGAAREMFTHVPPAEKRDYYPLSSAQKRLYILLQMEPGSIVYNMNIRLILDGKLDLLKLENTFRALIKRHEMLRTSFVLVEDIPVQRVLEPLEIDFEVEYYNALFGTVEDILKNFNRPFDPSQAPLLRAGLLKMEDQWHLFMVSMPHIISDALSQVQLVNDFMALYRGQTLPEIHLQYRDFSQWQNSPSMQEKISRQETYWLRQFPAEIPPLQLPLDYPRPRVRSFEGSTLKFEILPSEAEQLRRMAAAGGATLFIVITALFNILLSRLSGREDIVLGTVTAGRSHPDLEGVIGLFLNTMVLYNFPRGEKTFDRFLEEVKERTLEAFDHQDYQFDELVRQVVKTRDTGRHPLFDIMVAFGPQNHRKIAPDTQVEEKHGADRADSADSGLRFKTFKQKGVESRFDMMLTGADIGETFSFLFEFCTALFKPRTIERFARYFKEVVSSVTANPGILLKDIAVSTDLTPAVSDEFHDDEEDFKF